MTYVSTRHHAQPVRFSTALLRGLAPDGGLYTPQNLPQIKAQTWKGTTDFPAMATRILTPWLADEIHETALASILKQALDFPVPLIQVGHVWILELFHGPTLSFKDFGARTMSRLMNYLVQEEPLTILVATSGDTGSAVADGFANLPNLRVAVLYPKGQVSLVQERQLTARRKGVRAFAVNGTFDDCQRVVKELLAAPGRLRLSAANSINIGRLLPQMLYYYWAFAQFDRENINVCVPCGNLGNLTAGILAHLCGLPVKRFIAAHNANDGYPRFLSGQENPFRDSVRTLSNAMDVGRPSNFERLTYLLSQDRMRQLIYGYSCSDQDTLTCIRRVYEQTGYVADPHTAVALAAVRSQSTPTIVLSTAHPAKFPETMEQALGQEPDPVPELTHLLSTSVQVEELAPTVDALRLKLKSWN